MAVIRDVMPAFELFQPASTADALNLLDRYGSDVLPLALKMLQGEAVPSRSFTHHVLVTAKNVFKIYPPIDIN